MASASMPGETVGGRVRGLSGPTTPGAGEDGETATGQHDGGPVRALHCRPPRTE
jgi:hypothetical protein